MDVAYLKFPELFASKDLYQLKEWTKYSAQNAKKIFTISESSKSDIITAYHVLPEQVIVTYPGIKSELPIINYELRMKKLQEKFNISDNYVLFVGTLQPRKNIVRLIEAFAQIKDQKKDLQLVIVGKKGWQYEEILAAPEKFGVTDKVKFLDFVSDEDLPSLYSNALCYVLPSLYEGFGLPVLEAMKYNCPVITSDVSSLPEAGGDAALYIDPTNVDDIAEKIKKLISDEKLREDLIAKGEKQIKKFSWEKTAKETLEVLTKIAK
jgi:glycosyltransferase involved in cell wall biosynthesis